MQARLVTTVTWRNHAVVYGVTSLQRNSGRKPATSDPLGAPVRAGVVPLCAALACGALIGFGFWLREEQYIRPDQGLGYKLGLAGVAMMLLMMSYSVRKRVRRLWSWGTLAHWFRVHMVLGVVGPLLILFHANFRLGSANSRVALVSMLLVAGSGVVGRFIYLKVHSGVHGRRAQLRDLRETLTQTEDKCRPLLEVFPEVLQLLTSFESRYTHPPRNALAAIWRIASIGTHSRRLQRHCFGLLEPVLHEERAATRVYVAKLRRLAVFSAYERLFRLWHAVHVPLFLMLVATAVVHVVAVHMY